MIGEGGLHGSYYFRVGLWFVLTAGLIGGQDGLAKVHARREGHDTFHTARRDGPILGHLQSGFTGFLGVHRDRYAAPGVAPIEVLLARCAASVGDNVTVD